jgi:hypothetical protein
MAQRALKSVAWSRRELDLPNAPPPPPKGIPQIVKTRYERVCARLAKWESRERRAKKAAHKLRLAKRYYEAKYDL